jgi:endoglycosylceramidase
MGWTHWAYKFWRDPTTADTDQGLFRDDRRLGTAKTAKVRTLVRTYAQAVAGRPLAMRFDKNDGTFRFRYRPKRGIDAPTEIFVSPLHYPRGWRVRVDNGSAVRKSPTRILVRPDSDRVVTVRVVRRGR